MSVYLVCSNPRCRMRIPVHKAIICGNLVFCSRYCFSQAIPVEGNEGDRKLRFKIELNRMNEPYGRT